MISRRQLLLGATTALTGGAVAVVVNANSSLEVRAIAAGTAAERFRYRGRDVVITAHGGMAQISVDGRRGFHAERFQDEYLCHLLPFTTFQSPRELAQAVIDAEDADLLVV